MTNNVFWEDKILTVNPTNQQKLAEGSNHSQEHKRRSGNYFLKSDAIYYIRGWATKRRLCFQKRKETDLASRGHRIVTGKGLLL